MRKNAFNLSELTMKSMFVLVTAFLFSLGFADETATVINPLVKVELIDKRFQKEHAVANLSPTGFPKGVDIEWGIKRPLVKGKDLDYVTHEKFRVGDDGRIIKQNKQIVDTLTLSSCGYLPGERIELRFISSDNKFKYEMSLIPNPIKAKNAVKGISFQAETMSLSPTSYKILLEGIPNDTEITLRYTGAGQPVERVFNYDSSLPIIITPELDGRNGGTVLVNVRAKSRGTMKIRLPWGNRLENYLKGKAIFKG